MIAPLVDVDTQIPCVSRDVRDELITIFLPYVLVEECESAIGGVRPKLESIGLTYIA